MLSHAEPCESAAVTLRRLSVLMRPSEYTAALLRVIEQRAGCQTMGRAIDIGTGSGVLLAALSGQGAGELWGVDVDPDALLMARAVLAAEARGKTVHVVASDVWDAVPPMTFDAVVANLPHFPADMAPSPGRNPSWSGGGRSVLDAFLTGLPRYMAPDGVAWITHHALAGLDRTDAILAAGGLYAEPVFTWTVHEPESRMAAVAPNCAMPSLRSFGGYHFVDACVLEIRRAGVPVGRPGQPPRRIPAGTVRG